MKPGKIGRGLTLGTAALCASLMAFSVATPVTLASPNGDDTLQKLEQARQKEAEAAKSVNEIEKALADVSKSFEAIQIEADAAEYAYADAKSNLIVMQEQAKKARQDSIEANERVKVAKKELGHLARVLYTSQGSLSSLKPYISKDGLATAEMQNVARELFGSRAESKMLNFENILKVQKAIEARADQAEKQQAQAAKTLEKQKIASDEKRAQAAAQKKAVEDRRNMLIQNLAKAKNETVEAAAAWQREQERKAEEARQAALAKARAEAEAAAARARQVAEAQAAGSSSSSSSQFNNWTPTYPATTGGSGAEKGQNIANYARSFLGIPYVWGGTNPSRGLDCSGLMLNIYKAFGINLPRVAAQQRYAGTHVTTPRPGDMVNWGYHVGIYIGNGMMIHAPYPGKSVEVAKIWGSPIYVRVT